MRQKSVRGDVKYGYEFHEFTVACIHALVIRTSAVFWNWLKLGFHVDEENKHQTKKRTNRKTLGYVGN